MAELNVTIKYRDPMALLLFVIMCVLMPLWLIVAPVSLFNFVCSVFTDPGAFPPEKIVSVFLSLFAFTAACVMATVVGEDNRIHVSKDGLAFPLFLMSKLKFQRHASWIELTSAHVLRGQGSKKEDILLLGFDSGASLPLELSRTTTAEQEQLFMAIELWATRCKRSPELVNYQKGLQNKGRTGSVGYTQMWEEELRRRFSATTFIPLEPGQKLASGRLEIVRQLAFGGLSALYLAQHKQRDMVVLKEAVVPQGADSQARAQAEEHIDRESKFLSRLNHPNIARVLDHFVEDARHYLVLEFINGQDLRQFIKQNGPVTESQAIQWGIDIARILKFLHEQEPPIIHRDLTPDNLVLNSSGEVILIDFGVSNQFVGTATGTIVGKQAYIPAEQLRGKSVPASDIYALGGTIHYLLTGLEPVPLAVSHPRKTNQAISTEFDEIIAKCSAYEPQDRFHSASELLEAMTLLLPESIKLEKSTLVEQPK